MNAVTIGRCVGGAAETDLRCACDRRFVTSGSGARTSADGRTFGGGFGSASAMAGPVAGASLSAIAPFGGAVLLEATTPAESPAATMVPTMAKPSRRRSTHQIESKAATKCSELTRAVCRTRTPVATIVSAMPRPPRWTNLPADRQASFAPCHVRAASPPATPTTNTAAHRAPAIDDRNEAMIWVRGRSGGGAGPTGWNSSGGAASKNVRSTSLHVASSGAFGRSPMKS